MKLFKVVVSRYWEYDEDFDDEWLRYRHFPTHIKLSELARNKIKVKTWYDAPRFDLYLMGTRARALILDPAAMNYIPKKPIYVRGFVRYMMRDKIKNIHCRRWILAMPWKYRSHRYRILPQ